MRTAKVRRSGEWVEVEGRCNTLSVRENLEKSVLPAWWGGAEGWSVGRIVGESQVGAWSLRGSGIEGAVACIGGDVLGWDRAVCTEEGEACTEWRYGV